MSAIRKAQISAIHALKTRAGLDDTSYRDMLQQQTGERSAAKLTEASAGKVIDHLKALAGDAAAPQGRAGIGGPWGKKAQALWISGYHLGVFRNRDDKALLAFVRSQTGIDHLNWVRDPRQGAAVVEALKGWLTRAAGVEWREHADPVACVIAAQLRRLGGPPVTVESGKAERHALMQRLGERIRALPKAGAP